MSDDEVRQIISCIPVMHPLEMKALGLEIDPNEYSLSTCDVCKRRVWLGKRSAEMVARGAEKHCMICLIQSGTLKEDTEIMRLDDGSTFRAGDK